MEDHDPSLDIEFFDCTKQISLSCSEMMLDFAGEIISDSVNTLWNEPRYNFNAVAIGSLARGEATPFSDLEYLFLIEENTEDSIRYFERLAALLHNKLWNC